MLIRRSGEGEGVVGHGYSGGRGVTQKRKSPDLRFPEVGISANTNCMS